MPVLRRQERRGGQGRFMKNGIRNDLRPGCRLVSLCVVAVLAVLGGLGGRATPGQERRGGPKIIIFQDTQLPNTGQRQRFSPSPVLPSQRAEPTPALTPPRFKVPDVPAVEPQTPSSVARQPVQQVGEPATGLPPDCLPPDSFSSKRGKLGEQTSASEPGLPPLANPWSRNAKPRDSIRTPQQPGLLPLESLREDSLLGRAGNETPDGDETASVTSAVQPVSFAPAGPSEMGLGESPRSVVESTASPPLAAHHAEADVPAWRIVSVWVAISFSIALSLLACSLVLLTVRQHIGGKHGSILRVELTQPGGGSLVLPFALASQAEGADGRAAPSRYRTRVADLGDASLAAAMFGSILGEPRGGGEQRRGDPDDAIFQQILEDNLALQKGE